MDLELMDLKRRVKGMTVMELCSAIDVDESTYYKWRTDPDRMKLSTANKIASVLGMTDRERLKFLR